MSSEYSVSNVRFGCWNFYFKIGFNSEKMNCDRWLIRADWHVQIKNTLLMSPYRNLCFLTGFDVSRKGFSFLLVGAVSQRKAAITLYSILDQVKKGSNPFQMRSIWFYIFLFFVFIYISCWKKVFNKTCVFLYSIA